MATTGTADELNPLTGNDDGKQKDNMVEINLENPHDPPQPIATTQQKTEEKQQEEAIPGSDVPRQQDKDWAKEVGMACNKGYNWFPLGIFNWCGAFLLIICAFIDMFQYADFIEFWLYVYLIIGGLFIILIDMPLQISVSMKFVMKYQLVIYDWVKLFRRIWGRSILYIIMMITCASFINKDNFRSVPWIAGIYLLVMVVLSIVFSAIAAKKYNIIRDYIIKSTVINASDENEDDISKMKDTGMLNESDIDEEIALKKFISKFDELDTNKSGKLGMDELTKLGEQCGNSFSNSEKFAVYLLLDKECNGVITKPEWIMQLRKHDKLRLL